MFFRYFFLFLQCIWILFIYLFPIQTDKKNVPQRNRFVWLLLSLKRMLDVTTESVVQLKLTVVTKPLRSERVAYYSYNMLTYDVCIYIDGICIILYVCEASCSIHECAWCMLNATMLRIFIYTKIYIACVFYCCYCACVVHECRFVGIQQPRLCVRKRKSCQRTGRWRLKTPLSGLLACTCVCVCRLACVREYMYYRWICTK